MTLLARLLLTIPSAAVLAAVGLGLPGPADAAPPTGELAEQILKAGEGPPSAGTRGYVAMPPEAFVSEGPGQQISPIIYLNRCASGCTFTKSTVNDAIGNRTTIGRVPQGTQMTLTPFGYSEQVWNDTLACIRSVYQPFNVQVVTEDPGQMAHHEAVLAGRAMEMSMEGALGVAPLDVSTCNPQNNVVSFSYANDHGPSPIDMCWTVAQESAHAFGLDHVFECSDALTYIPIAACGGAKQFRNLDSNCGETGPRPCICGGNTQNSYQRILNVHGPGTDPVDPPVVDIRMPMDGATGLPAGFSVFPTAVDPRGLHHLELWINGWKWGDDVPGTWQKTSIYTMNLPARVPDGVMDIKVRGCGDTGVCGEDEVTVTRGSPCANADACLTGQKCEQGRCFWDQPTLEFGAACGFNEECVSQVCGDIGGDLICTESCVAGPNDRCPDGFECNAPAGQRGTCAPAGDDGGGCCSASGQSRGALAVNLGLGAMIGLLVVRRRRRARK